MKTVPVTSEAKASPIMTALTMMSADMNIDHGDNSCSATAVDFSGRAESAEAAAASAAAGAATAGADGACTGATEGVWATAAGCCATEGDTSIGAASTRIRPTI